MQNAKDSIFKQHIPTYNDGAAYLYKINQTDDKYACEELEYLDDYVYFEELSVTDKLRFAAEEREINISSKIRISQRKDINSLFVLKIGNEYFSVYNIYHFTNEDGYKQSDITLANYKG